MSNHATPSIAYAGPNTTTADGYVMCDYTFDLVMPDLNECYKYCKLYEPSLALVSYNSATKDCFCSLASSWPADLALEPRFKVYSVGGTRDAPEPAQTCPAGRR